MLAPAEHAHDSIVHLIFEAVGQPAQRADSTAPEPMEPRRNSAESSHS